MSHRVLRAITALAIVAVPLAACQTGGTTAAVGGAVAGAAVAGPVGAAVGGITGAAVGAVLTPEESARVRRYVVAERRPSVRVTEQVIVGEPLPPRVQLYSFPTRLGPEAGLRYAVVNERTVLVDPKTREVVQIIE